MSVGVMERSVLVVGHSAVRLARFGLACVAVVAVSAACGGGNSAPPAPMLPRALGLDLAREADAISQSLRRGQGCEAKKQAAALRQAVAAAVSAGRVPAPLRLPLWASADSLVKEIACVPPPAPPTTPTEGHHHGKHKGHGNQDDAEGGD